MAILTISREFGSGGRDIGKAVAESMKYVYVDKETVLEEIKGLGSQWEEWAKDLDERSPSLWERYDWSFRSLGAVIQSAILSHAVKDNVVIMGRGANFLLRGVAHALRIHVVAPMDKKMARVMERHSLSEDAAKWLIEKMDHERAGFVFSLYGRQWNDPSQFDSILNSGPQSAEETVAKLKELLAERDRLKTEESSKTVQMRAAAAKIKAGLLTSPSFAAFPTVDVDYDGKDIVLRGIVRNPKEHKRVEDAAIKLAGDQKLKCDLHYRS